MGAESQGGSRIRAGRGGAPPSFPALLLLPPAVDNISAPSHARSQPSPSHLCWALGEGQLGSQARSRCWKKDHWMDGATMHPRAPCLLRGLCLWLSLGLPGTLSWNRSCVFYEHPHNLQGSMRHRGHLLGGAESSTILCNSSQCCFGIWNQSHGRLQAVMQGCWGSDRDGCDSPACKTSPIHTMGAILQRCLCHSDLCNANISWLGAPAAPQASAGSAPTGTIWIAVACPLLLFLGCLAFLVLRKMKVCAVLLHQEESRELTKVTMDPHSSPEREPPSQELPSLQFLQVLQDGRFSVVWQGTLHQTPVAIKAFPDACFQHFAAEWSVHSLPLMNHDNVARLLAAGRGEVCGDQGSLLVLQLYPAGSLRHFLSQHVSAWDGTVRLALSLARGLAFLHEELWHNGLHKPSVAHRDLSSQNVLVREDRSCAIGDFGLATALPAHLERWGGGRMEAAVRKAGTQRYMAPEILDDSLDLQDWGRALKQADIYSLALVLWEILTRCSMLSPGCGVPPFQLAYEAELGSSPTYGELRRLAVEERRRPSIPESWKGTGQVSICLRELLEDCWDPDPEARLTAECTRQRLQTLGAELPAGVC
ncbi:anti-Muellerian hormone type-2 receptor [Dermochelys coriacea]|uniref:anti-Muellerian hormone type-2 receptor n=1 Tax=Dermochelys coriacea TaxID=27794 RepID=UPI001CA9956D|nr:anti-Muellerian hormone type-2 receptor [Dermochelys coriacea]